MELVPPFVPPLVDHTRYFRHAPARLRVDATCAVLHAVTRLFACWYHSGPLKALRRLGVGLDCLHRPK